MTAVTKILKNKNFLFLLTGGVNTLFSYLSGIVLFYCVFKNHSVGLTAIINSFISISFSFFTYKFFVFRSKNFWFYEYLKSYVVYGISSIFTIALLIIFVDFLNVKFWAAQIFTLPITVLFSYFGHLRFTFWSGK
jgi:putative flippase GtrA